MKHRVLTFALCFLAAGFFGCAAKQDVAPDRRVDVAGAIEKGRALAPGFENAVDGLCPDAELQQYVKSVGAVVVAAVPRWHECEYEFACAAVNLREPNAFALPHGGVYITRGLLERLKTEGELAAVIALELAHITQGDCACQPFLVPDEPRAVRFLKFSAEQETQAAETALFYLSRTKKYSPYDLVDAMRLLDALPEWKKYHPGVRAEDVEAIAAKRYPEFSRENRNPAPFPPCVERLQKNAPAYYAIFEDGEKIYDDSKAGASEEEAKLRLALACYDKAITQADEAGDLPALFLAKRGLARARLAEITNDENHLKAARADFDRAKQSDENCYLARLNRGRYFLETDGFYGPAEEELLAAMRLNPGGEGRGEPFYLMAKLYDDSRNPGRSAVKAAENYKKYLEREPDGRHAAEVRERLKTIAAEFPTP